MTNGALEQKNMDLMKALDHAWNSQDWNTFSKRHTDDVVVRWPAQPPTNKVLFAQGEWTCSMA